MSARMGLVVLVLITLIWGTTFAIVKDALSGISAPLLLALRFSVAALLLAWVPIDKRAIKPAFILGSLAFVGFASQTLGLGITSASRAAFITGLSVLLTPLFSHWWFKGHISKRSYLAAFIALLGLGLMTLTEQDPLNRGDLWVLVTAVAYAFFIIYLGKVANKASALSLSGLQLWPMALFAWAWALSAPIDIGAVTLKTWLAILYLASFATALVAVLQTFAQRVVTAHVAALIFILEPVFAAGFAYLLLGETLGANSAIGAGLILIAMLLSELPLET